LLHAGPLLLKASIAERACTTPSILTYRWYVFYTPRHIPLVRIIEET
jgi:hypothetical protein